LILQNSSKIFNARPLECASFYLLSAWFFVLLMMIFLVYNAVYFVFIA